MPLTSDSNTRPALINRTNVYSKNSPTPWTASIKAAGTKRPASGGDGGFKKRLKFASEQENNSADIEVDIDGAADLSDSDGDDDMHDIADVTARARRGTVSGMINAASRAPAGYRPGLFSTRPILQTFVSSHKADVFKCYSAAADAYLTLPYACAYSNSAKNGGPPLLAVATEQGSIHITNTSKRHDWDYEPQRTTLQPHENGIFDVKWNHSDTLLATASGDLTTSICCPTTQRSLYSLSAHTSTVKCISWDPNHRDLLSSGSRDGTVHIWDLRVESHRERAGASVLKPVLSIIGAHDEEGKVKGRKKKTTPSSKTITSLNYFEGQPYNIVSSGSSDGMLRSWDLRLPLTTGRSPKKIQPTSSSSIDPTTFGGSRPRGIISLTAGTGPTAGLLFALAADSRIHIYSASASLNPLTTQTYCHENLKTHSFYVRISTSPCGRWLASGGAAAGSAFLFDVSNAFKASTCCASSSPFEDHSKGVQIRGQVGEVAAVDWASDGMLATCADDGTVRVWRPDADVHRRCAKDSEESKWEWAWSVGQ